MARLPISGSDSGTWGQILNDFLSQAHNSDGTLLAGAVGTAAVADSAIIEAKLDSAVQTKLNGAVPVTRTVNSKALSTNITLDSNDVGAVANASGGPGRYLGYGTELPSSGMQAGDLFLLIEGP